MINPALETYPDECSLIGRMVVGYGELDITMVSTSGDAMGMTLPLLDALDQVQSEQKKIVVVRKLAEASFGRLGLGEQFDQALTSIERCRVMRNYLAHCHYSDSAMLGDKPARLLSVKAHDLFSLERRVHDLPWRVQTVASLSIQEKYFEDVRKIWLWLNLTVPGRRKKQDDAFDYPGLPLAPPADAGEWKAATAT